jgi:hypothetical protein
MRDLKRPRETQGPSAIETAVTSALTIGLSTVSILVLLLVHSFAGKVKADQAEVDGGLGYGFNVAAWDVGLLQSMGFNWMKVFNAPGSRLPVNVLLRVEAQAGHLNDVNAFGDSLFQLALGQKGFVDAYEIGNEPNLDASYGWAAAPNAADYAKLLCRAYTKIKAADPAASVISAGLAPTGRVAGNWNGHPGHNGFYQDERQFFSEFLAAGGGNCLDGVGYHPYGFSADFDAVPDVASTDPTQNCANGFCFRGSEKIYELMQANGLGHKKIWATEFGWIVHPPLACLSDPGWQGRGWQIVSEAKQASNLVGAFQYASANWPWMEAMFIFNLNFNETGRYPTCEQMRYYGVAGRPAEAALRDMPKFIDPPQGELEVIPQSIARMITPDQQPFSETHRLRLGNVGTLPITFTLTIDPGTLSPALSGDSGTLDPAAAAEAQLTIDITGRPIGVYSATVTADATSGTAGVPLSIPVSLLIVDEIHHMYLPIVLRD